MNITCKNCGAPIEANSESCPYCGSITPYGEEKLNERKKHEQEEKERNKFLSLPRFKFVSPGFLPVVYFFTAACYSPYWYLTRMNALNLLVPESKNKLPKWAIAAYAVLWLCMILLPGWQEDLHLTEEQGQNIINLSFWLAVALSIWLAYIAKRILQEYAAKFLEKNILVNTVASSNLFLILFGAAYIQTQINKLIAIKILAPKI